MQVCYTGILHSHFFVASFNSLLALSQQEELVDLPKDYLLSGSEDEVGDNC